MEFLTAFWQDVPEWAQYLIRGLTLCALLCFGAVVAGRAGRSPYWALLLIVPLAYVPVAMLWIFAYSRWPRVDGAGDSAAPPENKAGV